MCRIEEKVYEGADGKNREYQCIVECDRARRRGKRCSRPGEKAIEYIGGLSIMDEDTSLAASNNPPTPTGAASYTVGKRRPSLKPGSGVKPEVIIHMGSGKERERGQKHPRAYMYKSYKRSSLGAASSASNEATAESPSSDANPPFSQPHNYTTRQAVPQGHHLNLSASSATTSQTPSLYTTSETEPESPLGAHLPEYPRTIGHNTRNSSASQTTSQAHAVSSLYRTRLETPHSSSYDTSSSQDATGSRSLFSMDHSDIYDVVNTAEQREHRHRAPQKSRRLMSGKEMANREVKRRRRVVNDESTDEDSEEEVRAAELKKQQYSRPPQPYISESHQAELRDPNGSPHEGVSMDTQQNVDELDKTQSAAPKNTTSTLFDDQTGIPSSSDDQHTSITHMSSSLEQSNRLISEVSNEDDNRSIVSSIADSIFSNITLESAATGLTLDSGYSASQVVMATHEVLSILQNDSVLSSLYGAAQEYRIGPQQFEICLRHLLRKFSSDLKEEASDRVDFLAAALVKLKARYLARMIREDSFGRKVPPELGEEAIQRQDEDSGEEDENPATHEAIFQDLPSAREFILASSALKVMRDRLGEFVTPSITNNKKRVPILASSITEQPPESTVEKLIRRSEDSSFEPPQSLGREFATNTLVKTDYNTSSDIESELQAPTERIDFKSPLIKQVAHLFVESLELLTHHKDALSAIGPRPVVEGYCAILESFHNNIVRECKDESEKAIAQLFLKKSDRMYAAKCFLEYLEVSRKPQTEKIDTWTKQLDENVQKFLLNSAAFYTFKIDIQLLCLPSPLQDIIRTTPKNSINISSEQENSFSNMVKGIVEDYTEVEWDWWPLASRVRRLENDQLYLRWKLFGQTLHCSISSNDAETIEKILAVIPAHPSHCFCCTDFVQKKAGAHSSNRSQNLFQGLFHLCIPITRSHNGSGASAASKRYTPIGPAADDASNPACKNSERINGSQIVDDNNKPSNVKTVSLATSPNPTTPAQYRVLFGIQGHRWSLELEKIEYSNLFNDPEFFSELKVRHRKYRGWIKRLISPFRFRFCKFVKFEKLDANRVLSQGEDLPEYPGFADDYEYAPRPGRNPLIDPKTFSIYLKACGTSCILSKINPWHDCVRLPRRSDRLRCIPKKKTDFDISSDDGGAVAWGLEADYMLSFVFVTMYHLVPILLSFAFWIYWLVNHPGDWQNAAVPLMTVLALFAVFWIPFGKQSSKG